MKAVPIVAALIFLTALSAFFDARGFVYAAETWRDGSVVPKAVAYSMLNFLGGVALYIASIGLLQRLGVQSATMQTLFWFAMTIIGIAIMDGTIAGWSVAQKVVGVAVAVGISWLLVSAGH